MPPTLPRYKRVRPEDGDASALAKLDDAAAGFAESLTGAAGILSRTWVPRSVLRTIKATIPDPWVPLELLDGATTYNPDYGIPAARWTPSGTEYRGLVLAGINQGAPFARIPSSYPRLRTPQVTILPAVSDDYSPAAVEVWPDGSLYFRNGVDGWLSLWNLGHPCAAWPTPWPDAVAPFVTYGEAFSGVTPMSLTILDAMDGDGNHFGPLAAQWENSRTGQFAGARIRYIHNLSPGEYTLRVHIAAE